MNETVTTRKVCLVGDFAVGKSSLLARFVHQDFSDRYLSTVGVSIKTKPLSLANGSAMKLVIWDIAGNDSLSSATERYLRGADGYLLIVDGTRPATLESALRLRDGVSRICGSLPHICLLNKHDLSDAWALGDSDAALVEGALGVMPASAKTGENVERAFLELGAALGS